MLDALGVVVANIITKIGIMGTTAATWLYAGICSASIAFFGGLGRVVCNYAEKVAAATGILDPEAPFVMDRYCENLTEKSELGQGREAVERTNEINAVINILSQENKANVCITGDPGVGKTALVEGLAYNIAKGNVPDDFKNKKIIKVNMVSLIAGNSYSDINGAVNRMRALFDKAKEDPDIILFIDEFHQIVQCNAAELFKTYLDRPGVHVIAATTTSEYSYISKDPALERRFTKLSIEELNASQTLSVLKNLRPKLEEETGIKISDDALTSTVDLTGKYMRNRTYPDKAIDVISLAAQVVSKRKAASNENLFFEVKESDIQKIITSKTGIPLGDLTESERTALDNMNSRIANNVVGQEDAINKLCDVVRKCRGGFINESKPRASFLFTGTHGVGKTLLAERIGHEFGNFIKLDVAHFGLNDSFLEKVWKKPYSVVVFDNLDRASQSTFNDVLGILENGFAYDSHKRKIDFTNSIVIMTANVGDKIISEYKVNEVKNDSNNIKSLQNKVSSQVEDAFGMHFVNAIDDVLVFNKLNNSHAKDILKIFVDQLTNKLSSKNIKLEVGEDVIEHMAKVEIDSKRGAIALRKMLEEKLETPISVKLVKGEIKNGNIVCCKMDGNKIIIDAVCKK